MTARTRTIAKTSIPTLHVVHRAQSADAGTPKARRGLMDARRNLSLVAADFQAALDGDTFIRERRTRGQPARHFLWDMGHSHENARIFRMDGLVKEASRKVLRVGRWAPGDSYEVELHGRPRPRNDLSTVSAEEMLSDAMEAIHQAMACVDVALVTFGMAEDAETTRTMGILDRIAHEQASRTKRDPDVPDRLAPAIIVDAATPWSKPVTKLRHPHLDKDAIERTAFLRPVPMIVDVYTSTTVLKLSALRTITPGICDPMVRMRAIAELDASPIGRAA